MGVSYSRDFIEFNHEAIFSFEVPDPRTSHDARSTLSLSPNHYKHRKHSLKWSWNSPDSYWSIREAIDYVAPRTDSDPRISTFVFWIYSTEPIPNNTLKVEFLKEGRVTSYFEYRLDFKGWRGAWVAFDRDGKPERRVCVSRFPAGRRAHDVLWTKTPASHGVFSFYKQIP